ncbi:transposase/IS protein [Peptococcaceae bacterium CEB3]|nr:transposase/IS protein [Peptococcaceae bacterium CEB3]
MRITKGTVEIFFDGNRICSHPRLYGRANQYHTVEDHMPPNHQQYVQWNGERFAKWAAKIGYSTETVVRAILAGYKVEQQGYKACWGRLRSSTFFLPAVRAYPWCGLPRQEGKVMLTVNTVTKLREMHLRVMASAFKEQLSDPQFQSLSFEDRYGLIVDKERCARKSNHLKRLIKQGSFSEPGACVEDIEYHLDRNVDKDQISRLSTCNYIVEHHNVILLGATGSYKTYLAYAPGMAAVRNYLTLKYIRLPELLVDLSIARGSGTIGKVVAQYEKYSLLIMDEWLLYPLMDMESRDLLEIIESQYKKVSTIFCSQFDIPGWRDKLGDPTLADAICDRIIHNSYTIVIDCKDSMRKRKGIL